MDYSNLNIDEFKYTKLLNEAISSEKKRGTMDPETKKKKIDRASGYEKLAMLKAHNKINKFFYVLAKGSDDDRLLLKQLKLEKEYIKEKQKEDLKILIEQKTGQFAAGAYTLAEIGDVLGVTRERVRQIEAAAEKVLKHPTTARRLKSYREQ